MLDHEPAGAAAQPGECRDSGVLIVVLAPEQPELVVGRLLEISAADLADTAERSDRHVLEPQLGVVGQPGEHRLPVPGPDAVIERAHVPIHELPTCHF